MNNNRGNNRRRGRGNNRPQGGGGGGGGQQTNRIDSRARGNAPQMLEKYRKLASDAHLNGDRVTEEYYLQFADHYFRVISDTRQRQEELRQPRTDRWQDGDGGEREDGDNGGDYGTDEYQASPYAYSDRGGREEPQQRYEERQQPAPAAPVAPAPEQRSDAAEPEDAAEAAEPSLYEPVENPFTRDNRGSRGLKPRRARRDGVPQADEASGDAGAARQDSGPSGLDLAALPPSIAPREAAEADAPEAEAKPKRRAPRRPKPPTDDGGEPLQAVN